MMNLSHNYTRRRAATIIAAFLSMTLCVGSAVAQTTAFTYQGKLSDGAQAAGGTYDLDFILYDAETGGTRLGAATQPNVTISGGIFTVRLDFGVNVFAAGANRFLQISVKKTSETNYTTLTPRQPITSVPYAIRASSAAATNALSANCVSCLTNNRINSVAGTKITGSVANADNATNAQTANTATTAGNVTGVAAIANGGTGSQTKNFVDLTIDQTVAGNKTLTGNLRVNGLIRTGSETGTTEPPQNEYFYYDGLIVRRINSLNFVPGQVIARTFFLRLERDGTAGGWRIANRDMESFSHMVHCLGITNTGAVITARLAISGAAATRPLFTNAQNVEYMQCSFGGGIAELFSTEIVLQRDPGDFFWVGTMTSATNQ